MAAVPFLELTPAHDCTHAQWLVDAMQDRDGVAKVIPTGYDAYLRIHHPLSDGGTWADAAPTYLKRGTTRYDYPFPNALESVVGSLDASAVDRLTPVLAAATTTPHSCHFGLWVGWGDLDRASHGFVNSCPVQPWWGGRDTLLFDGNADDVRFIGSLSPFDDTLWRRSPQWWWPDDRAWFLANEIDYPWTYLGGSVDLIERARTLEGIEAVVVHTEDEW